jgi:hypothetical protein
MPVIAALVEGIALVDPETGSRLATRAPGLIADELELQRIWSAAGFSAVSGTRIRVTQEFASFDELWRPLLAGSTPSTLALAALPARLSEIVRGHLQMRFSLASGGAGLRVTAEAIAVRGTV